ncbi:YqaJ viral recombinase family protein [Streptomyces sp. H27-H5]|uniref:YqaJ viral recombinase family nuclease n=1 Tax=Streptomyces sp. H27-H5 TaxID=2996460 RepID=UPI002270BF55|nr:YqaJ viral recombinase family protein [Streptomyces sp. H27-H5]MCY0957657.1 YqaJ viral recombinase family protein [Streptomyces sp. H27-H5]
MTVMITPPLFDLAMPIQPRTDAPTARLLLPSSATEEEWHAVRRSGIGGSDVAAILGLDKYRGPRHVFEAKHGRDTDGDNEAMEFGRELEDVIARTFSRRSGIAISTPPGTLVHTERAWMLANVDRYALDAGGAVVAPVECKNRSEYQADDWEDGVPDSPAIQAHWYMAVGGWDYAWVVALIGGNRLKYHRLERDEELIGYLTEHCGSWYQRHIVEGFPPPADGLEATKELLGRLWTAKADDIVSVDPDLARDLRARRGDLRAQIKALETALTEVENEMRLVNGPAEVAKCGNSVAWSWKQNGTFPAKRFREAHPELAAELTRLVEELDVDQLKEKHPDLYASFRARVLRVPTKEL